MEIRIKVERPSWLRVPRRRSAKLGVALLAAGAIAVPVAWANHTFLDVPTSSPHHADISTIARAGITNGCNPPMNSLYCPDAAVRRDQMGSFIARTLRALTPVYRNATEAGFAIDFDASPVLCPTGEFTPTVASHAKIDSWVSAVPGPGSSTPMGFSIRTVVGTVVAGTLTWAAPTVAEQPARAGSDSALVWAHASRVGEMALNAGTTYRFGVQAMRDTGMTDALVGVCQVLATITYADAGASSIGSGSGGSGR